MPVLSEKEKIQLAKMTISCSSFYHASLLLLNNYQDDINQQFPIMVNASFTSELALKVMIANTQGCFVHGHNLYVLFAKLDEKYQNLILDALQTAYYPQTTREQLLDNIKAVGDAFKKVRYFGENTLVIDWIFCIRLMMTLYCITQKHFITFCFMPVNTTTEMNLAEVESEMNEIIKKAIVESEKKATNEQNKLNPKQK